jgi:hypothetical protein
VLYVVTLRSIHADELTPLPALEQVDEYRGKQKIEDEGYGASDQ